MVHELKTLVDPFVDVKDGFKRAEFRRDDRGFARGDTLVLRAWIPGTSHWAGYTGGVVTVVVTHVVRGPAFGIPEGYVMMSLGEPVFSKRERTPPEAASP